MLPVGLGAKRVRSLLKGAFPPGPARKGARRARPGGPATSQYSRTTYFLLDFWNPWSFFFGSYTHSPVLG